MSPRFFYFDLGNVVLGFDYRRAAQNLASCTGVAPEQVRETLFETGFQQAYETGQLSSQQLHQLVSDQLQIQITLRDFLTAISDMFWINAPVVPILAQLRAAGHRLGILSNTCDAHWLFIRSGRYRVLDRYFEQYILSFEVQAMKPHPQIYEVAQQRAGELPEHLFFVDDRIENVEGARQAGWDALLFQNPSRLARDLLERRVPVNL